MCLGGGSSPTTSNKPLYQPTGEGAADTSWQNIAQGLFNQWQGGQSPGQMYWGPTQQAVGQVTNNPYSAQALQGGLNELGQWQSLSPQIYRGGMGQLQSLGFQGAQYMPNAIAAAFNPTFGQVESDLQNSPYLNAALAASQSAAGYGATGASQAAGQSGLLNQIGSTLPGWAQGIGNQAMAPAAQMQTLAGGLPALGMSQAGLTESPVNYLQNLGYQAPGQAQQYAQGAVNAAAPLAAQMGRLAEQQPVLAGLAGQAASTFQPLTQAAQSVLQQGYDPQSALFNRTQQQVQDQQNAINAMSGVASSPYGAGLTGQQMSNFDINWQNNLLNRMNTAAGAAQGLYGQAIGGLGTAGSLIGGIGSLGSEIGGLGSAVGGLYGTGANISSQGLANAANMEGAAGNLVTAGGNQYLNALSQANALNQGAGSLYGQGANIYGQGVNLGSNLFGQATNLSGAAGQLAQLGTLPQQTYAQNLLQQLAPATQQAQVANIGTGAIGNLVNSAGAGYGQAANLLNQYLQGIQSSNAAPYNTQNLLANNTLGALSQGINLGQQQYQLPENLMGNMQAYMGLGQNASQISNQIGAQQFAQQQSMLQGIGSLLGLGSGGGGLFGGGGLLGFGLL